MKLPKDIILLLLLNKKKNCDSQAALLKIIMTHFSGSEISGSDTRRVEGLMNDNG